MKTDRHTLITQTDLDESVGLSYRLSDADFDGMRSFHAKTARKWIGSRLAVLEMLHKEGNSALFSLRYATTRSAFISPCRGLGWGAEGCRFKSRCGQTLEGVLVAVGDARTPRAPPNCPWARVGVAQGQQEHECEYIHVFMQKVWCSSVDVHVLNVKHKHLSWLRPA